MDLRWLFFGSQRDSWDFGWILIGYFWIPGGLCGFQKDSWDFGWIIIVFFGSWEDFWNFGWIHWDLIGFCRLLFVVSDPPWICIGIVWNLGGLSFAILSIQDLFLRCLV